jgi:hypothetical protein
MCQVDGRLPKLLLGANLKIQIVSASTIMHMLTDKFVEPSMNQALIVNQYASRFSITSI